MSAPKDRLALALDVPTLSEAERLVDRLAPWFGVAKVGLELYVAEGPSAVGAMRERGLAVFADLKLHDIPTTVERAARAAGRLGVNYLNVHAAGGEAMVRAGVEGFAAGAAEAGTVDATLLAVTVLTSDRDGGAFGDRLDVAHWAGCGGVVCSGLEVEAVKGRYPDLAAVVPGTRPVGAAAHDQVRSGTPGDAVRAGADLVVIGRAVTRAADPEAAAAAIAAEVEEASGPPG